MVGGDPRWVAAAANFAGDCAERLGGDGELLRAAVSEACHNVVAHAYEAGEEIGYQVTVEERDGSLIVGVVDQGITFSLRRLENPLFQRLDTVRLLRLGKLGKRLELISHLSERDRFPTDDLQPAAPDGSASPGEVTIRQATPDDAVAIARCVYRCYARSYGSTYLYMPEKLKRMWEAGTVISVVALADGELVGHLCYWLEGAQDPAGQATDAVVDPRFRGHHLFEEMKQLLIDITRAQGRVGMISEAVTVHPYTQKGVLALGAIETGLMLGDLPANLRFKGIEDTLPARQSCMLCYMRLNPEPDRVVYLPERHRAILEKVYAHLKMARQLHTCASGLEGATELELHLDTGWQEAGLRLIRYGQDLTEVVRTQLHHLLASGLGYLYLELPLTPGVGPAVLAAEELGFSFAGLVPEANRGDLLRMHYVTNLELDPKIQVASEWGGELREYVLACAR